MCLNELLANLLQGREVTTDVMMPIDNDRYHALAATGGHSPSPEMGLCPTTMPPIAPIASGSLPNCRGCAGKVSL